MNEWLTSHNRNHEKRPQITTWSLHKLEKSEAKWWINEHGCIFTYNLLTLNRINGGLNSTFHSQKQNYHEKSSLNPSQSEHDLPQTQQRIERYHQMDRVLCSSRNSRQWIRIHYSRCQWLYNTIRILPLPGEPLHSSKVSHCGWPSTLGSVGKRCPSPGSLHPGRPPPGKSLYNYPACRNLQFRIGQTSFPERVYQCSPYLRQQTTLTPFCRKPVPTDPTASLCLPVEKSH